MRRFAPCAVVCLSVLAAAPSLPATSLTLSATPNPSRLGSPVQLTVTAQGCSPGDGARVTFYDGAAVLGRGTIGAPFTTTMLPAGARALHAYFAGNAVCAAAASPVVIETMTAVASNYVHWRGQYLASASRTAAADLNGDGIPDVAVANGGSASILLGKGDATFTIKGDYATGISTTSIAVGDWNGDGKPDLVVSGAGATAVLTGNGDGSFFGPRTALLAAGPLSVADFDGDGLADIAVSSAAANTVYILLSNGDGTFRPVATAFAGPGELAIADFNLDGRPDLAVTQPSAGTVAVLLNAGAGGFGAPAFYSTGGAGPLVVADFNRDGFPDIAVYGLGLVVFLGKGDGTFQSSDNYFLGGMNSMVAVDFNGDGILDIVGTNDDLDEPHLLFAAGNGDGSFQKGWPWGFAGGEPRAIVSADFDGDGRSDFAVLRYGSVGIITGVTATMVLRGTPQSAPAGTPYAQPLEVRIVDSAGLPIANIQVTNFGRTDANGSVSKMATASTTPGLTLLPVQMVGAPSDGGPPESFGSAAFVLLSTAPPTSLDALTPPQSAEVTTRFLAPLQVRLANMAGATVTFTAPASGASAALSSATAITDLDGYASVFATANNVPGSYTVTASGGGFLTSFSLTNTPRTLAGCWTLDAADVVGNQALDCSGNGLTGSISGSVTPTAGAMKEALRFDGGSIAIPDSVSTDLTHDLTLAVWLRSTNTSQKQNFLSKYDFSGAESGYLLQLLPTGVVNLRLGGNNFAFGSRDTADVTPINDGKWHHVAVVITLAHDVKFYIDGRLRSTASTGVAASRTTSALWLGTLPGAYNGSPFFGSLDDARIFSRALAAGEVAALLGIPAITGVTPESVPAGRAATITVNGSGFVPSSVVIEPDYRPYPPSQLAVFPTTFVSPTQLTATIPLEFAMSQTSLRLQVFNASQSGVVTGFPFGPGSNFVRYTIDPLIPELASISPYAVRTGSSSFILTARGANFIPDCLCPTEPALGSRVYWNGTRLDPVAMSETSISSIVPASLLAAPGTAIITVANPVSAYSRGVFLTVGSGPSKLTLTCAPATGPQQAGAAYSSTCTASGGAPPYFLAVGAGLPAGLAVTSTTATSITISGVPLQPGAYAYSVAVRDSNSPSQMSTVAFNGTISGIAPPPPVPTGLAGYWSFDTADLSGGQALDRSGNGLNGAVVNANSIAGRVNQALRFSGAGSYVSVPDNALLQLTRDLTFATWIQTSNNTEKQSFLSKYDFSGSEYGYMLQVLPSGVVNLRLGGNNLGGAQRDFTDTKPINDGQWHHVAVVLTATAATFYVDGQLSSSRPLARVTASNWAPLCLGTLPGSYNGLPFSGALDEVRIYGGALSAAEIAALAQASAPPPPPPPPPSTTTPAGYWAFDGADLSGSSVADRSGHGLTGTRSAATSSIAGRVNEALRFAGGYVAVPDASSLELLHDVTLTAWLRATSGAAAQNFLGKYDFSGAESGYLLQLLPTGVVNLRIGGNNLASGPREAADSTAIGDGAWHHVAVVITLGKDVKFYVDGQLRSTAAQVVRSSGHTTPLYLGSLPGSYSGVNFFGDLDEVRVYNVVLTAAEIAALAAP